MNPINPKEVNVQFKTIDFPRESMWEACCNRNGRHLSLSRFAAMELAGGRKQMRVGLNEYLALRLRPIQALITVSPF